MENEHSILNQHNSYTYFIYIYIYQLLSALHREDSDRGSDDAQDYILLRGCVVSANLSRVYVAQYVVQGGFLPELGRSNLCKVKLAVKHNVHRVDSNCFLYLNT